VRRHALPLLTLAAALLGWEALVRSGTFRTTLPAPSLVLQTLAPTSARWRRAGGSR
jgi:ABC-type nitrate/sulfonate/bicarbonate transport system permease component